MDYLFLTIIISLLAAFYDFTIGIYKECLCDEGGIYLFQKLPEALHSLSKFISRGLLQREQYLLWVQTGPFQVGPIQIGSREGRERSKRHKLAKGRPANVKVQL